MATKEILILWMVLVYCHGRKGPYGRNFINHLCTGSAPEVKKCKEIAAKCIVKPKVVPIGTNSNWHDIYCKTFDTCLEQTNGTREFYDAYLQERQGRNRCPSRKPFGIKNETNPQAVNGTKVLSTTDNKVKVKPVRGMTFEDYLVQVSGANVAAQFVCCFAKANGKFNANGTVNVDTWKADASTLEDITHKTAIEKSIEDCVTQETSCSVSDFKQCVVTNCYNSIKQTMMNITGATVKN